MQMTQLKVYERPCPLYSGSKGPLPLTPHELLCYFESNVRTWQQHMRDPNMSIGEDPWYSWTWEGNTWLSTCDAFHLVHLGHLTANQFWNIGCKAYKDHKWIAARDAWAKASQVWYTIASQITPFWHPACRTAWPLSPSNPKTEEQRFGPRIPPHVYPDGSWALAHLARSLSHCLATTVASRSKNRLGLWKSCFLDSTVVFNYKDFISGFTSLDWYKQWQEYWKLCCTIEWAICHHDDQELVSNCLGILKQYKKKIPDNIKDEAQSALKKLETLQKVCFFESSNEFHGVEPYESVDPIYLIAFNTKNG